MVKLSYPFTERKIFPSHKPLLALVSMHRLSKFQTDLRFSLKKGEDCEKEIKPQISCSKYPLFKKCNKTVKNENTIIEG